MEKLGIDRGIEPLGRVGNDRPTLQPTFARRCCMNETRTNSFGATILSITILVEMTCNLVTSHPTPFDHLSLPAFPKASLPSRSTLRRAPVVINQSISFGPALHKQCQLRTSAAAIVVNSAFVSYAGATSTISAETMWRPSKPLKMVRNSRVDQPPVSGVPVAGAKAGSIESICEYYEIASRKLPDPLANPIHSHRWKDKRACRQQSRGSS